MLAYSTLPPSRTQFLKHLVQAEEMSGGKRYASVGFTVTIHVHVMAMFVSMTVHLPSLGRFPDIDGQL